jgi:hypothetical protein
MNAAVLEALMLGIEVMCPEILQIWISVVMSGVLVQYKIIILKSVRRV